MNHLHLESEILIPTWRAVSGSYCVEVPTSGSGQYYWTIRTHNHLATSLPLQDI